MPESSPKSESSSTDNHNPFWDAWTPNAKWRNNLARRATHKALGVDDMGDINAVNTGFGWKELLILAAAAVAGIVAWQRTTPNQNTEPAQTPAAAPAWPGPPDSEYEVRFFDADGNPIAVPHVSQRPAE